MSAFRGILTGYLGAKIADTEAADRLKGEVLVSAGKDLLTNILPEQRAAEELRRTNYNDLKSRYNPNIAELGDINNFTRDKASMEKYENFLEENKLKDPEAFKNLQFETDYNPRYDQRGKNFNEKYDPILKQLGIDEIGGMGYNTVESLVGGKEPGPMKSEDMTQTPEAPQEFASTQLSDYFTPTGTVTLVPENEFAKVASTMRGFQNAITFDNQGNAKFNFKGTKDTEYNALRAVTNDVALTGKYTTDDNKTNVGRAVEEATFVLKNQTQDYISNNIVNKYSLLPQEKTKPGGAQYTSQGFSQDFQQSFPSDSDKLTALENYMAKLGSFNEQKYFAESFPLQTTVTIKGKTVEVRDYLLSYFE